MTDLHNQVRRDRAFTSARPGFPQGIHTAYVTRIGPDGEVFARIPTQDARVEYGPLIAPDGYMPTVGLECLIAITAEPGGNWYVVPVPAVSGEPGPAGPPGPQGPSGQAAGKIFYLAPSDASDISTYKTMLPSPSAAAEQTIATSCTGTGDILIASFATDPGIPGAVDYPAGTAYRRIYAMVSAGTAKLKLRIYKRDLAGVETLVRDEASDDFINTAPASIEWSATAVAAGALLATDRIVAKLYAARVAGPTTITLTTYYEGTARASQIQTTISSGAQGPIGPAGPTGPAGSTGSTGAAGAPGSVWRSGTGAPSGALGIVGDWYENDANGDIYEKTGVSTYTLRDNLTGPTGATGAAGTVSPGSWTNIPGAANWVQNDVSTIPRMRKDSSGTVFFEGALRNTAGFAYGGVNSICAILTAGYRPLQTQVLHAVVVDPTNGPKSIGMQINPDGNCHLLNLGAAVTGAIGSVVYVSNISFLAA